MGRTSRLHAFIDVETTGLSPATDAVTEIGVLLRRGEQTLAELSVLVDPCRSIPAEVSMMTGITDEMVLGLPRLFEVAPAVRAILRDAVVVGHNVAFDLEFLSSAMRAAGLPSLDNDSVDTVELARRLLGDSVPDHRLCTVAKYLQIEEGPAHRALGDARITAAVFRRLAELDRDTPGAVAVDACVAGPGSCEVRSRVERDPSAHVAGRPFPRDVSDVSHEAPKLGALWQVPTCPTRTGDPPTKEWR